MFSGKNADYRRLFITDAAKSEAAKAKYESTITYS